MKNVMNLTSEEKFNQEIWWILQEIKKEGLTTPKDEYVCFEYQASNNNAVPPKEDQRRTLNFLKNNIILLFDYLDLKDFQ